MSAGFVFDVSADGSVWRLQVSPYRGAMQANWRRWWWKDGTLTATQMGAKIPLERLPDLHAALGAFLATMPPDGPPTGD